MEDVECIEEVLGLEEMKVRLQLLAEDVDIFICDLIMDVKHLIFSRGHSIGEVVSFYRGSGPYPAF